MKEIHDIRLNHYNGEFGLSEQEIIEKRRSEAREVEKIISEYGFKVFPEKNIMKN